MKKITLLLTAALILHLLPAHAIAEFYLKINRSGRYTVQFADQRQFTPSNQFRFHDLMAGVCNVQVTDDYTQRIVYSGSVTLSDGYRTVAELDNYGTIRVIQNIQIRQTAWYLDDYPNYGNNGIGYGNGIGWNNNNNYNGQYGGYGSGWGTGYGDTYSGNSWSYNNGGSNSNWNSNNSSNWNNGTDESTFRQLKDYVSKQSFDSNKLSAAKESSRTHRLKSSQVAELCKLFSFDDNRLEYAKYAYDYVTDKSNYFLVNNTFSFSSNSDELRTYIAGR